MFLPPSRYRRGIRTRFVIRLRIRFGFVFIGGSESRVACEVLVTTNFILLAGEVLVRHLWIMLGLPVRLHVTSAMIVRLGFSGDDAEVVVKIHEQSPDIIRGECCDQQTGEQGAGDQGMMFGFACSIPIA